MTTYAPDGFAFFSVSTPNFFSEFKLPIDDSADNKTQAAQRNRLERAAEAHGTYVRVSSYRLG